MKNAARLIRTFLFRDRPVYVHYGITHRCNLRCRMCSIDQGRIRAEDELSLENIGQAASVLRSMGTVYISLGGGEPLVRSDIVPVVRLLRARGFMVRLLTNGLLAHEGLVRELACAGLREVSVSLDSMDAGTQAYLCDAPDTRERVVRSMELFSKHIPVRSRLLLINTVVSPFNVRELPELSRFAKSRGYYISFIPVEAVGKPEFVFGEETGRTIDDVYDRLLAMKRSGKSAIFNSSAFLEKSRRYLKSGVRGWECDAGRLYLSLDPRGMVSMCHYFEGVALLGNGNPGVVSPQFRRTSEARRRECPGCMRPCWAELSFLFKGGLSLREMAGIVRRQGP
jgi:MoaA/NifB/PqqE/SkfB family radical SAM enzyme